MKEKYVDITKKWRKSHKKKGYVINNIKFKAPNGKKYFVDNKKIIFDYSYRELEMAIWLQLTFGNNVYLNPKVNYPKNVQTADYYWKKEHWDLKTLSEKAISQKRAIDNIIKNLRFQAQNLIIDITKSTLETPILLDQVKKIYSTSRREWVKKIIVIKDYEIIKIYKRK